MSSFNGKSDKARINMKDLGLVHIWGNGIDLGGPVAILLETDAHFLGAMLEDKGGEKLVLHLLPKSSISKNTGWQRSAPYSERLLRHVATLDAVAGKGQGNTESEAVRIEEPDEKPVRVFGKHGAVVPLKPKLPLPPIPTSRKPGSSNGVVPRSSGNAEVAAVKADLDNLMGKYKQIVSDTDKKKD